MLQGIVAAAVPDIIKPGIDKLLDLKRNAPEIGYGPPVTEINQFIQEELDRHGEEFKGQGRPDLLDKQSLRDDLNVIFRNSL